MKKIIDGKVVTALLFITNTIYGVMIFWSLPKLQEYSGGMPVFDMSPFGYSLESASMLLDSLGSKGIQFYKEVQIRLDLLYPLGFIFTYSISNMWLFGKTEQWRVFGKVGAFFAVVAGLSDYVENFYILKMLNNYPDISEELVYSSSVATTLKSTATIFSLVLFLLGLILFVFSGLKTRRVRKL